MQLEDSLPEAPKIVSSPPLRLTRKALPPQTVRAFGSSLALHVTSDATLRDDSCWRLQTIYEPALSAQSLNNRGNALDIGAGFGCFTIPFARANRGWTIWAFEPEPEAYAALCMNIRAQNLTNVIAINAAVTGKIAGVAPGLIAAALHDIALTGSDDAASMVRLTKLLPRQNFRRHVEMRGVIELGAAASAEFEACDFPCVPAEALVSLQPSFLKLVAPFSEAEILTGLADAPLDHIIGESWTHIPSALVYGRTAGQRATWIPRAGDPLLRLRRSPGPSYHRPGLDIVVALHNSREWIMDCVTSLLADADPETRVLVVDDGSTDGSGEIVAKAFAADPRVILFTKENGGCASARNFGRMHSDASHIAFVDADDMAGPGLFTGLLDLARHTGAEMVQGGFDLWIDAGSGATITREASYEAHLPEIIHAHRHPFGDRTCLLVPSWLLTQGQPSIWRRIYRRDFLDNKAIWFPEHIRAFDDQIFQLLCLQYVHDVPMLDGVHYLYRQHSRQDIRQGDERIFYSLEMFRLAMKRGITDGWNDFRPTLSSFVRTINWSWANLRPDLRPAFLRGAAELWAYARHSLPPGAFDGLGDDQFDPPDFGFLARAATGKLRDLDGSFVGVYLDSIDMHPSMLHLQGRPETST